MESLRIAHGARPEAKFLLQRLPRGILNKGMRIYTLRYKLLSASNIADAFRVFEDP